MHATYAWSNDGSLFCCIYMYTSIIFSTELQQWVGELEQLLASATESCQKLLSQHVLPSPPPDTAMTSSNQDTALVLGLRDAIKIILEQCSGFSKGDPQLHIQVASYPGHPTFFNIRVQRWKTWDGLDTRERWKTWDGLDTRLHACTFRYNYARTYLQNAIAVDKVKEIAELCIAE